jgi:hypothetical protein
MEMMRIEQAVMWRRLDGPGHDVCTHRPTGAGWRLTGCAVFREGDAPCNLGYLVDAGPDWRVRSAHVFGTVGTRLVDLLVIRTDAGWRLNGRLQPHLGSGVDLDLGFTPAAKLFTLRRLSLAVGGHAQVDGVAMRVDAVPILVPTRLACARLSEREYAFDSGDSTATVVRVDRHGMVVDIPGRWAREDGKPVARVPGPPPRRVRADAVDDVRLESFTAE